METLTQLFENFGVSLPKFGAQLLLFAIVYVLLSKFAFGPVLAMLEERRKKIEESQHNAEKIKRQLAEAELRYQEILRKANEDAVKLLDEARAASEAHADKATQQAIKDAESIILRANESVSREREKMLAEVKSEMIRLVVETTSKVADKVLTPADQKRLSEDTARELAA